MSDIIHVEDRTTLQEALEQPRVLLYKHSNRCWVSQLARRQVRRFNEKTPDLPVYQIDVIGARDLSQEVAGRLGVPHASPQAILLVDGEPVWSATHGSVRVKTLDRSVTEHAED